MNNQNLINFIDNKITKNNIFKSISYKYKGIIIRSRNNITLQNITHIIVDCASCNLINKLPSELSYIKFKQLCNVELNNLPLNLKYLKFNINFNQLINNLPTGLICIILMSYNKSLNYLPNSIIKIKITNINSKIDNLPSLIKMIKFDICKIDDILLNLPPSVKTIEVGKNLSKKIDKILPFTITCIIFNSYYYQIENFPNQITHIIFNVNSSYVHSLNTLPSELIHLVLPNSFNHEINSLPLKLKYLELGKFFNKNLDNLPDSLVHLKINLRNIYKDNYDHDNYLCFKFKFNTIPKSLKIFEISADYIYINNFINKYPHVKCIFND